MEDQEHFAQWQREVSPWAETRAALGATWDMYSTFILAGLLVLTVVALGRSPEVRSGAASYGFGA